ncbi:MAG TPA: SIS domain-containing protein [Thermoanaerobaculia bacterium]|jgi:uncharacterized phosphosugar-binding protein
MSGADGYLGRVGAMIESLQEEQLGSIREAGRLVAEVLRADRLVHVFGTGHSHMLAEEGLYRAGGLAPVNAILESGLMLHEGAAVSTRLEKLPGYSPIVADKYGFEEGDLLVVVSNSGVNAAPVEIALLAREAGLKVLAISSVAYSKSVEPKPGVPARLYEIADLTLDNLGEPGDAIVEVDGTGLKVGPTSTVIGAALLNAVFVEATCALASEEVEPPVYRSSNMTGAPEHNRRLVERFGGRIRHL